MRLGLAQVECQWGKSKRRDAYAATPLLHDSSQQPTDSGRLPLHSSNLTWRGSTKAAELLMLGSQLLGQHPTGTLGHGVITTGEHIHRGVAGLGPGVDRNVRLGKQGKACHPMGLEVMGDQLQQRRTSTQCGVGDGRSEKRFIVEPGAVAVVELEDAMFTDRIGDRNIVNVSRFNAVSGGFISAPSGVGVEVGEGVAHVGNKGQP